MKPRRWITYLGVASASGFIALQHAHLIALGVLISQGNPIVASASRVARIASWQLSHGGMEAHELATFIAGAWCSVAHLFLLERLPSRRLLRLLAIAIPVGIIQFFVATWVLPFFLLFILKPGAVTAVAASMIFSWQLYLGLARWYWVGHLLGGLSSGLIIVLAVRLCPVTPHRRAVSRSGGDASRSPLP